MPIPVITNFSINDTVPFDTRLVATSSTSMDNMLYKYAGLTTYRSDLGLNYTYDGSTWAVSSNGIYGGSGNLSSANTIVNFGTVSTALNDLSKYFTFKTYTDGFGDVHLDLENYFIRNADGSNHYDVSYKSQLMFNDDVSSEYYPGPYIMYNPKVLFNSGRGGISFGTLNESQVYTVYERMRIDGNGIIRFKPNATVDETTKSVNIGIDSTNTRPFIGFNWNGSDVDTGTDASYVQFNDSVVSIHNFSSTTGGTHSAIFSKGLVRINGALSVSGDLNFRGDILYSGINTTFYIGRDRTGLYFNSGQNYVSLTYLNTTTKVIHQVLNYNDSNVVSYKDFVVSPSSTGTSSSSYPIFQLNSRGSYWDFIFNPNKDVSDDENDNKWYELKRNGSITTLGDVVRYKVNIYKQQKTDRIDGTEPQDARFRIAPWDYSSDINFSNDGPASIEYYVKSKSYDRIFYFYSDSYSIYMAHELSWYLGYLSNQDISDNKTIPSLWKKIGRVETGNKDNINNSYQIGGGYPGGEGAIDFSVFTSYQVRTYSHSVVVPAGMFFKFRLYFPYSFTGSLVQELPATIWDYCQSLVFTVLRSGRYTLGNSTRSLQGVQEGISGKGSDYTEPIDISNNF